MNRDQFMKELEYLLMDIPEEEKADAVGYYRDYLEEAGPEGEEAAIREFGSPERVAAIIRSDLAGSLEQGGEFTETGYQDERFKDPNTQMAERFDLPDVKESSEWKKAEENGEESQPRTSRIVKLILWILLIIVAAPMLFGIGGGILGIVGGFLGVVISAVVALAVLTLAFLVGGLIMLIWGIVYMVMNPLNGALIIGLSIVFLGIGMVCLALCGLFYGKFIPFLVRGAVNLCSSLIYGRRSRR